MSVDESTVIFGPIDQVGWASASSMVTSASSAAERPRNGPAAGGEHEAGHPGRDVVGPQALVEGAVLAVDRDQLGPRGATGPLHDRAGGDQRLLVGQRQPAPGLERGEGDGQAGEAHHAVDDHVGLLGQAGQGTVTGPHLALRQPGRQLGAAPTASATATTLGRWASAWAISASICVPLAPMAVSSKRSGSAASTSSVWVPIEPVEPARATRGAVMS